MTVPFSELCAILEALGQQYVRQDDEGVVPRPKAAINPDENWRIVRTGDKTHMSVIYSFKEAYINKAGVWIKSAKDGPEIMLEPREAMALAESIIKQGRPKSAAPARRSASVTQRSALTTQRSAAPVVQRKSTDVAGKVQSVGKSSYQQDSMKEYAQTLAKNRALSKLDNQLKGLANQGKTWNSCKTTTQIYEQGYTIQCVAQATLGD